MRKLSAILVGLECVDSSAYNGWSGQCLGCELDVDNIHRILEPLGYSIQVLKTAEATRSNILQALDNAASTLNTGDNLVFFFSGHGGQQPDVNGDEDLNGDDFKPDKEDETLVAYDGVIIDDELDHVWMKFRNGVRIVMLSDSCNSGTNYRMWKDVPHSTHLKLMNQKIAQGMQAQMIHMGGCEDDRSSYCSKNGGVFTLALCQIWNQGGFRGNYQDFLEAISRQVQATQAEQRPQYNEYGPVTDSFRQQIPFSQFNPGLRLSAAADTYVRADLDIRMNDNYGHERIMAIGTGRFSSIGSWGAADAMRALIRFDLPPIATTALIQRGILQLTVHSFGGSVGVPFTVEVHRVTQHWLEGNGAEGYLNVVPNTSNPDAANGVAWKGVDSNNQAQPAFDPTPMATALIDPKTIKQGDVVKWDITAIVQQWIRDPSCNFGIILIDPTTDGNFRELRFGTREADMYRFPDEVSGPRLLVQN